MRFASDLIRKLDPSMRALAVLAAAACCIVCSAAPPAPPRTLAPRAFNPLSVGSVTPSGWLLKQLQLQADGLSGHLSSFWQDVEQSVWVGGSADNGLHERAPYWLNGIVPLAFLLQNAADAHASNVPPSRASLSCVNGTDMPFGDIYTHFVDSADACALLCNNTAACAAYVVESCASLPVQCWLKRAPLPTSPSPCRCLGIVRPTPAIVPTIMEQALTYVNYILHAQEPSGWLGPSDAGADGNIYWGRFDVLLALTQYAEANATAFTSTAASVLAFCLEAHRRMQNLPLEGWSAARGMDFALTVQWLLTHAPQGHEQDLFELLDDIRKQTRLQGVDWENWFASFPPKEWPDFLNHGVNNAQALKSAAVWYVSSGDISLRAASLQRLAAMDATFGFPNGMFCADETLCAEAGQNNMPSRGSELCAVVEAMFSYATMFSVHGDAAFAERLERIAFNALPATWSSPSGGDMWAHQYLQAVNQVRSASDADHVWTHDGPDAELYGLEPNYGCCTANFNQGWPKFAHSLFFASADGGVAIAAYAPASANLPSGGHIKVDTEFPFSDTVNITIMTLSSSITLHLRIPSWSHATIVVVNGSPLPVPNPGTLLSIPLPPSSSSSSSVFLKFNPEIRIEHWCTFPPPLPPSPCPFKQAILHSHTELQT